MPSESERKCAKNLVHRLNAELENAARRVFVFHASEARSRGKYHFFLLVRKSIVNGAFRKWTHKKKGSQAPAVRRAIVAAIRRDGTATSKEQDIGKLLDPSPSPPATALEDMGEWSQLVDGIPVTVTIGASRPEERRLFLNALGMIEWGPRLVFLLEHNRDWSPKKIASALDEPLVKTVIHHIAEAEAKVHAAILNSAGIGDEHL